VAQEGNCAHQFAAEAFSSTGDQVPAEENMSMAHIKPAANNSVQATPGCAFCEFLSQVSGAPDRRR
jgi:hypothetical protein